MIFSSINVIFCKEENKNQIEQMSQGIIGAKWRVIKHFTKITEQQNKKCSDHHKFSQIFGFSKLWKFPVNIKK